MLVTEEIYIQRVNAIKEKIDYSEYKYSMDGRDGCPICTACECFRLGSNSKIYISSMTIEDHYDEVIGEWLETAIKWSNKENQSIVITNDGPKKLT
jgi:hypothetical protein